jgi:hypothetical protein
VQREKSRNIAANIFFSVCLVLAWCPSPGPYLGALLFVLCVAVLWFRRLRKNTPRTGFDLYKGMPGVYIGVGIDLALREVLRRGWSAANVLWGLAELAIFGAIGFGIPIYRQRLATTSKLVETSNEEVQRFEHWFRANLLPDLGGYYRLEDGTQPDLVVHVNDIKRGIHYSCHTGLPRDARLDLILTRVVKYDQLVRAELVLNRAGAPLFVHAHIVYQTPPPDASERVWLPEGFEPARDR